MSISVMSTQRHKILEVVLRDYPAEIGLPNPLTLRSLTTLPSAALRLLMAWT